MHKKPDFHLFVSYTRTPDAELAREVERFLEAFHTSQPPGDSTFLPPLRICVDGSDFSMPPVSEREGRVRDVLHVVYAHLARSRELLVLCSEGAARSDWVEKEIRWFIEKFGSGRVRIAFTEGVAPWEDPGRYCPAPILEHDLNRDIAYDLRGYDKRRAEPWKNVNDFSREMVRLAADLHGRLPGDLYPTWLEAELERARRQSATMASNARFETFSGDPARAVLAAYQAHQLHPDETSEAAMRDAYRVAVMHHHNRRQISQITGSGPSHLAKRWKQGDVFTKTSHDGRFRLLVTERGRDGPNPPGEVFLLNNETLRAVQLLPPKPPGARVEEAAFDRITKRVFVTRYFNLYIYDTDGGLIGQYAFSRFTKSPVHLVDGLFMDRWILGAETKGGVWLVDPDGDRDSFIKVHREFYGDATLFTDMSPDRSRMTLVYESGKASLLELSRDGRTKLRTLVKKGCLFAGFPTGCSDTVVTSERNGVVTVFDIQPDGIRKRLRSKPMGREVDWVSWDADTNRFALVGGDRRIYIADAETGIVVATLDYPGDMNWSDALAVQVPHTYADPGGAWEPGEGIPFPADDLAVSALECNGDQTLLVTEEWPNEYWPKHRVHLVENDRAYFLEEGNVPIVDRGGMLKLGGSQRTFARVADYLRPFPAQGLVDAILETDDALWVGTRAGAYRRDGSRFERMTPAGIDAHDLVEIDGVTWMYGMTGAYAYTGGRLLRITDPFLHVSSLQKAYGRIWILAKTGPAWWVDDWLATAVPDRATRINRIFETPDGVLLAGETGLYSFRGRSARRIELDVEVKDMRRHGRAVWCTTKHTGFMGGAGPLLRIDSFSLKVQPFDLATPVLITAGDAIFAIHSAEGNWPMFETPVGHRLLSRLDEQSPRLVELGDANVKRVLEHLGVPWVLTSRGAFKIDSEQAVPVPVPSLSYTGLTSLRGTTWLFADTGAVRFRGGHATAFETGNPVRAVLRVLDETWLLTVDKEGNPGPAYRVQGKKCIRHGLAEGAGVASVVDYQGATWFLTRRGIRASPMVRAMS